MKAENCNLSNFYYAITCYDNGFVDAIYSTFSNNNTGVYGTVRANVLCGSSSFSGNVDDITANLSAVIDSRGSTLTPSKIGTPGNDGSYIYWP